MSTGSWDGVCPVCLRQNAKATRIESAVPAEHAGQWKNQTHSDEALLIDCPACGNFAVTTCDRVNLTSNRLRTWDPIRLSALLREQTVGPLPTVWLQSGMEPYGPLKREDLAPIGLNELLARWPRTVPERLERTLCNIARLSPTGGHLVTFRPNDESMHGLLFASTQKEAFYHLTALTQLGFLEKMAGSSSGDYFRVTPRGWARFDQLTRGSSSPENPVFVAMWFGVETRKDPLGMTQEDSRRIFKEGIRSAARKAGYDATRVDQEHFNDAIMDQVLGLIRAAPFVVADLTGQRPGVYLEAGFAKGLGLQVIYTCSDDRKADVHFDCKHLNIIFWKDAADLQERLYHRIRGTIGLGPYPTTRQAESP